MAKNWNPKAHAVLIDQIEELAKNVFDKLNVGVQFKAYKNGVGKSDVPDIRDTVEHRDYDRYFLATSN